MTTPVNDAPAVAAVAVDEEVPELISVEVTTAPDAGGGVPPVAGIAARALRWLGPPAAALAVFALFLLLKGASPAEAFEGMWRSAFGDGDALGETVLRTLPLLMAALAVAVPARAGLFNIGGEGQLLLGAIGAQAMAMLLDGALPSLPTLVLMAVAGMVAGLVWAAIAGGLRVATGMNEAISSLLLNYLAAILLAWLVFEPWKDPNSLGQAYSEELVGGERLPVIWGDRVHAGVLLVAVVPVLLWLVLRYTPWGFKLRVVGGNPEAARRAGLRVGGLGLAAMALGGAIAGLGGMLEVAGVEGRLRPDMLVGFGYIGFLASWLGRHHPLKAIGASAALAAVAVGGNGLKVASGLSGAAVNVLMALVLLAVLGWSQKETGESRESSVAPRARPRRSAARAGPDAAVAVAAGPGLEAKGARA
jgi:simple sugar transport system permease protein